MLFSMLSCTADGSSAEARDAYPILPFFDHTSITDIPSPTTCLQRSPPISLALMVFSVIYYLYKWVLRRQASVLDQWLPKPQRFDSRSPGNAKSIEILSRAPICVALQTSSTTGTRGVAEAKQLGDAWTTCTYRLTSFLWLFVRQFILGCSFGATSHHIYIFLVPLTNHGIVQSTFLR